MVKRRNDGKKIITRCCSCQKIRNKAGEWLDLEKSRLDIKKTLFSHSVCPACLVDLYPEIAPAVGLTL